MNPPSNDSVVTPPESFCCPISGSIMDEPVVDYEGNTYNRDSIEAWLKKNSTSPVTRSPLTADRLSPNRALAEAIAKWKAKVVAEGKTFVERIEPKPISQGNVVVNLTAYERGDASLNGTHDVLVELDAGKASERTGVDVVCVIDISGSMQTEASTSDGGESNGLSILDIVKHAVATVIQTLGPNDRIALVSYSSTARIELELTATNEAGQKLADTKLRSLHTEGSTNLWDGLLKGMDVLRAKDRDGRIPTVFLLTDGQPNVQPPRGHLQMLQRYNDEHSVNYTINTFGFGYSLNSQLLDELAIEGGGAYAFIPEATFVGTCFVSAISNMLVTAGADVSLSIEPINGAKLIRVRGGHGIEEASWGQKASLGTLSFGQRRTVVLRMDLSTCSPEASYCNATLQYVNKQGQVARVETSGSRFSSDSNSDDLFYHNAQSLLCETTIQVMELMAKGNSNVAQASALVAAAIKKIENDGHLKYKLLGELLKDLTGQITEATSRQDWWQKWGRHYLPSLGRAHQIMQCNNFKDHGIQFYGGEMFQKQRDIADAIFLKLPPPTPSRKKSNGQSYQAVSSMNAYYDSACVCFSGDSLVSMIDGSLRPCSEIRRGDQLLNGAKIVCVVKTICPEGLQSLVRLSADLQITPWHPICTDAGKWTFPLHLAPVSVEPLEATFNFVLDQKHEMLIGGVRCCTLGHGVTDDSTDIRSSVYWGRDVVSDLASMPGFDQGFVTIAAPAIGRSPTSGLVCRLMDQSIAVGNN